MNRKMLTLKIHILHIKAVKIFVRCQRNLLGFSGYKGYFLPCISFQKTFGGSAERAVSNRGNFSLKRGGEQADSNCLPAVQL